MAKYILKRENLETHEVKILWKSESQKELNNVMIGLGNVWGPGFAFTVTKEEENGDCPIPNNEGMGNEHVPEHEMGSEG